MERRMAMLSLQAKHLAAWDVENALELIMNIEIWLKKCLHENRSTKDLTKVSARWSSEHSVEGGRNKQTYMIGCQELGEELHGQFENAHTRVWKIWTKFKADYSPIDITICIIALKKKLVRIEYSDHPDMNAYLNAVSGTALKLQRAGKPLDNEITWAMLLGLPKELVWNIPMLSLY